MNYGLGENDITARGTVSTEAAERIRRTRVAEQWERYDSIVIGQGANLLDNGWFNDWAAFANADELQWFSRRSSAVGQSFTNQNTERTDWAQDIYQTSIEFIAPPGIGGRESDILDEQIFPILFTEMLPTLMPFRIRLAESDDISLAPGNHYPAGFGVSGGMLDASGAPSILPGSNGEPHVSNSWKWPEPVMLPAQGKITVIARVDNPIRGFLRNFTGSPGAKSIPGPGNVDFNLENFYQIKITHRGPRYLQLRGGRSASGGA